MHFPTLILLAFAACVSATTHVIVVGDAKGDTIYTPPTVTAKKGDYVTFQFEQKNHSATQSSFNKPCTPKKGGFDSGFHPVPPGQTSNFPTFTIPITNENEPIFFHCEQGANTNASHCGKGMVGIINPHGLKNFGNFQRRAFEVGIELGAVNASVLNPHGYGWGY